LTDFLSIQDCPIQKNAPLREHCTFKTGGKADLLAIPENERALISVLDLCREKGLKYHILGNGSNVLMPDEGLRGAVVKIADGFNDISIDGDAVTCGAGAKLTSLCLFALKSSLSGLEFAYGIPGTVGGAVYMNAGAYGGEIKDVILSARHIDGNLNPGEFIKENLKMSYRRGVYTDSDYIITGASFRLKEGDPVLIKKEMDRITAQRASKQPLEYPNAGSIFKRPEGFYAGTLIEECGLKGFSIGGAAVSEKHAGFIINKGGATSGDVLKLIKHIQDTVLEKKGVLLETEVKVVQN